jgi:pentapeptide MXKDX repeat protein
MYGYCQKLRIATEKQMVFSVSAHSCFSVVFTSSERARCNLFETFVLTNKSVSNNYWFPCGHIETSGPKAVGIDIWVKMSVDKMSVDKMSVDKMSVDKMSVDKMSVDKMSVDKMSVDKMSLDKMSVDKMSVPRLNVNTYISVGQGGN